MMNWYEVKLLVAETTTLGMDALHVIVGIVALIAAARLLDRPLSDIVPWLAVLSIELTNEAVDLGAERWPDLTAQVAESVKDVWLTMLIPTVILLLARRPRAMAATFARTRRRDRA